MTCDFHVIIPARYQSTRFPGKLLQDIQGQSVIERVYQQALKSKPTSVVIATDHEDIFKAASAFGADVVMTDRDHLTGTDRIAEVIAKRDYKSDDIIVNVQGDEPMIPPELIIQVAQTLQRATSPMATLCWPIDDFDDFMSQHVVKVVRDSHHHALYFSRSPIPAYRDAPQSLPKAFRHVGLYAYRCAFLQEYVTWPVCELEDTEMLEQLRVLWAGHKIKVEEACVAPKQDINTRDDLNRVRKHLSNVSVI